MYDITFLFDANMMSNLKESILRVDMEKAMKF